MTIQFSFAEERIFADLNRQLFEQVGVTTIHIALLLREVIRA